MQIISQTTQRDRMMSFKTTQGRFAVELLGSIAYFCARFINVFLCVAKTTNSWA